MLAFISPPFLLAAVPWYRALDFDGKHEKYEKYEKYEKCGEDAEDGEDGKIGEYGGYCKTV